MSTSEAVEEVKPSHFAALGSPKCSCWGKSEIEWIALAYVTALAHGGDTWRRLTRQQVFDLLTEQERRNVWGYLTSDFDVYKRWFEAVADRITDAEGAFSVGGFVWSKR